MDSSLQLSSCSTFRGRVNELFPFRVHSIAPKNNALSSRELNRALRMWRACGAVLFLTVPKFFVLRQVEHFSQCRRRMRNV